MSETGAPPTKNNPQLAYGDVLRFSQLALERFGLSFSDRRRSELEWAVRQAFANSTCTNLNEYYELLQDPSRGAVELERLVNALTVSETHFFRDAGQFDALINTVLPGLIERRRFLRTLRIWSAGCASGEEPYSIAMLLRELIPDVDQWSITILGTDINTTALDRARKATYGEWAFREERARQMRARYFKPIERQYELAPEVRRMVTFTRFNLLSDPYPDYSTNTMFLDIILCRNVTIYFPESVTRMVVGRYYQCLADGGWLIVGHSEHALGTYQQFRVHNFPDAILYQRSAEPGARQPDWQWAERARQASQANAVGPANSVGPANTANTTSQSALGQIKPPEPPVRMAPPAERSPAPAALPIEQIVEQARQLLDAGHSEQARDLLLPVASRKSPDAAVCTLLGQAYANLSAWPEAQEWCELAIKAERLNRQAYYLLALVHQHREHLGPAIEAMKKVIYIDPNFIIGHYNLATLYYKNGQRPQAIKSLDNARRLLAALQPEEMLPESGGVTAGRLLDVVTRVQQQWAAPTAQVSA